MNLSTREGRKLQGERIKRAAKDAGLSLDELSAKIGCSRALIYQYVSGASLAQPDRLQEIGAVIGKPLTWFFSEDTASAETDSNSALKPVDPLLPPADESWIQERIAHLSTLLTAYSNPINWRKVAQTCEELIPYLLRTNDKEILPAILFKQGNALAQCNELGEARAKLEQAGSLLRASGNTEQALDSLQSLGQVNIMLGRTDEALKQFEQVAAGEEWAHRWKGTLSMGAAHEVLGHYTTAQELFLRALQIVDEVTDEKKVVVARLYIEANWANLELDWGEFHEAVERAGRCAESALSNGIEDQYIEALMTRGMAYLGLMEWSRALSDIRTAYNIAQVTSDSQRAALARACESLCLNASMRTMEAIALGKEALSLALKNGANRAEILSQQALAEAYLVAGNIQEAKYHLNCGCAITTTLRLSEPGANFELLLASIELVSGNYEAAKISVHKALEIADSLGLKAKRYRAYLILGQVSLHECVWADALHNAEEALFQMQQVDVGILSWQAQWIIAAAKYGRDDVDGASAIWDEAIIAIAKHRQAITAVSQVDNLLEHPDAIAFWRFRLRFLLNTGKKTDAMRESEEVEWPPIKLWFDTVLEKEAGGSE